MNISRQFSQEEFLADLNPAQRRAVSFSGDQLLVLAGAGSGKTKVLTYRAAWLAAFQGVAPENILLLTFTNKAAGEMRQRLYGLFRRLRVTLPQGRMPVFAGTFHSFALMVLRRDGRTIGLPDNFVIYDENDQKAIIKKQIREQHWNEKEWEPARVRAAISRAKSALIGPEDFMAQQTGEKQRRLAILYRRYQQALKANQALDFGDLLFFTVRLLRQYPEVLAKYRHRYRYLLIDEYQDTNQSQYQLTKMAARDQSLTAVGDASQAIYGWRGADYHNLLALRHDFPKMTVVNLEQNYRSTANILAAADAVISNNVRHPILHLKSSRGSGEKIRFYQASDETDEAKYVAGQIQTLREQGWSLDEIAILYRTNSQSRIFEETFLRYQIPYFLLGGVGFYNRAEVKDILALLRIVYQSDDRVAWERIEKNMGVRRRRQVENFLSDNVPWQGSTAELLEQIVAASGYLAKFQRDTAENRRRRENIDELFAVSEKFPSLGDFLNNAALFQNGDYKVSSSGRGSVRLMTIHSSKGLEFRAIFLTGMEDGIFPDNRSLSDVEKLEEERRLCYVGITRAKERLFLSFARRRYRFGSRRPGVPSRFLAEIPEELFVFGDFDDEEW